jgi:hypothetical protein
VSLRRNSGFSLVIAPVSSPWRFADKFMFLIPLLPIRYGFCSLFVKTNYLRFLSYESDTGYILRYMVMRTTSSLCIRNCESEKKKDN